VKEWRDWKEYEARHESVKEGECEGIGCECEEMQRNVSVEEWECEGLKECECGGVNVRECERETTAVSDIIE